MNNINIKIHENMKFDKNILNMKLVNMYCKHMILNNYINKSKANQLLIASNKIGYKFCEWGTHDDFPSDLSHHLSIITKMESDKYNHAVRVVICKYKFCDEPIIWTDNLHSTVKYIREHGKNVKLKDIPFYIVDLSDLKHPIIGAYNKNVIKANVSDVLGAISSAYFRYEMSNSQELINIAYLVGDLLNDNPELYTYHNTHIGCIQNGDSPKTVIEKSQAFNSLWDFSN